MGIRVTEPILYNPQSGTRADSVPHGNRVRIGIFLTDCHPDRSFSYPKGMRSGVEGPAVSYMDTSVSGNKNRKRPRASVPQPSLASKERTGHPRTDANL